jgi:uncharacterized protein (TIGR00266 family)
MQTTVDYRPSYSMTTVTLAPQERIQVEAGSMVGMSPGVAIDTSLRGGVLSSLKRSVLGGESFFINTYQAPPQGGQIMLAPALPGDMTVRELAGHTMIVQSGSYVASSEGIQVDTKWGGAKTFFGSEGLFMLKVSGSGTLILSSYGAIHEVTIPAGQTFTVDTGHVVAFADGMGFNVRAVGGLKSTLFSGEGLVVELTGPGKVNLQSRSQDAQKARPGAGGAKRCDVLRVEHTCDQGGQPANSKNQPAPQQGQNPQSDEDNGNQADTSRSFSHKIYLLESFDSPRIVSE